MKKLVSLLILIMLISSCSSTKVVDSWRNKAINKFQPKKVLILGMTDNLTARKIFEEELTKEFRSRGINARASTNFSDDTFMHLEKSEEEIDLISEKLIKNEFDAVLITVIKNIDEKQAYSQNAYGVYGSRWPYFGRYYNYYQDYYYTPVFYEDYKVYHVETSIYNINTEKDKSLVWVGSIDIVDPKTITTTVKEYTKSLIKELEKEKLIPKK